VFRQTPSPQWAGLLIQGLMHAYRLLAFGDIRHVAGVGAKNRTNPSLKRFWVG